MAETGVADSLRSLQGEVVRLNLRGGGPGELRGRIRGLLESADGLVVYVVDETGRVHTVHHHMVLEVEPDS